MMPDLPSAFLERMKNLLGSEYVDFLKAYSLPLSKTIRVNLLKSTLQHFREISPFKLEPLPFAPEGFSIGNEASGRHPWHHAGLFYFQEASAMSPVSVMDPKPGMKVLDLCAAPGSKATQAAARLAGSGLIVCNEIVSSRARILVSNIERCGVRNALVTNENPENLCEKFRGFFDSVLVDAPCSGEGMFRKDPSAVSEWTPESPAACAKRQLSILNSAKIALKEGGTLVYSTCTFSPEENEGVIEAFLKENPDFEIIDIPTGLSFGREAMPESTGTSERLKKARRVFPQDGGEGHFVAKLMKHSGGGCSVPLLETKMMPVDEKQLREFYSSQFRGEIYGKFAAFSDQVYIFPENMPDFTRMKLRPLRAGVFAGRLKKARFEPEHALYMAAKQEELLNYADFSLDSAEISAFLHGEEVAAPLGAENGYAAVCAQGFPVGFGKISGGVIKNHYPKGLRNL